MDKKKATILLQSGDLDKALCAFIFANGYAALGIEVKMWFMIWGYNCLKKRKSLFSLFLLNIHLQVNFQVSQVECKEAH